MKKKVISTLLAVLLLLSVFPHPVFATEDEAEHERLSDYLNMCFAELYPSGTSGKLDLAFEVVATGNMNSIGVVSITVRNNNGSTHSTIVGSIANGLLDSNTWYHTGEYSLNLTSGNTYYCTVILGASDANGGDSRKITTSHVVCP